MKVILYMASTINGYIAREDDSTPWSDEEWKAYAEMTKKTGNIIIGHKTYEIMKSDFQKIGNPFVIVVTRQQLENNEGVAFVKTPEEAIQIAQEKGYAETMINGGSTIINLFAEKNLIDEIYLDIEPFIFGKGKQLFLPNNIEFKLHLEEIKKYSENGFQVRYSVLK